ncbi:acyltransferase family protein [Nocardia sp. NPDC004722]
MSNSAVLHSDESAYMKATRDRYIDTIRALAIVRVIVYHALGFGWLTIVFPSMGIMFALAGSLMAASLAKAGTSTIGHRLRRLLPPFWAYGAVAVSVMLIAGWTAEDSTPPTDTGMLFWILPLTTPPSSEWGEFFVGMLWYISTYIWFVLLSPVLLPLFRRMPAIMLGLPFALLYVFSVETFGISDTVLDPLTNCLTYLACWLLGFAHQDGTLARLRWRLVLPVAAAAAIIGGWLTWLGRAESEFDLTRDAMPNAFWSFAFVLLLLRFRPDMSWLARTPRLDWLIGLLNARAVTIYLWHTAGIVCTGYLLTEIGLEPESLSGAMPLILGTLVWTTAATLLLGWVEDVAARRSPSLLPSISRSSSEPGKTDPEPTTDVISMRRTP